jgi:hypothetical protein
LTPVSRPFVFLLSAYGYGGYQNQPAALPLPKQELPPIPPSYSQHN